MARPLRIQAPGLTYHVTSRGTGRMTVFLDDRDRQEFLDRLAEVVMSFHLRCVAYCLMTNHYHLVITTEQANLSQAMKQVNGPYGQWWNRRHDHVGHVSQGRFSAQVVQDEPYLLTVCRYVVMNPVRGGLAGSPGEWPWSSYGATAGLVPVPSFMEISPIWDRLGATPDEAQRRYREFVTAARPDETLSKERILGDARFKLRFAEVRARASTEVPFRQRRTVPELDVLFRQAFTRATRCAAAARAQACGYGAAEVADFLGLHRSTVSRMIQAVAAKAPGASEPARTVRAPAGPAPAETCEGDRPRT